MRYGYWLPVFGGWLRNVEDEGMSATWDYVKTLARRSEEIGFDLTLIAELLLNDIKGIASPSLDAWSTAAALAAVAERHAVIDFFMLGTGRDPLAMPSRLRALLAEAGVNADAMTTGAAIRTYNIMLGENRRVAAGLIAVP